MGLDQRLSARLSAHENSEVRAGGSVLERDFATCDDASRKCQDGIWTVLFLLMLGFVSFLALDPKAQDLFVGHAKHTRPFLVCFVVTGIAAALLQSLAKMCPKMMVYAALLFSPALMVLSGLAMALTGLLIPGVVTAFIGAALMGCVIYAWRPLIPFTALVVAAVCDVIEQRRAGFMLFAALGCIASMAWFFLFFCACAAVYLVHEDRINEFKGDVPMAGYGMLFIVLLLMFWGSQVVLNVCQVAYMGLFGRWYFGKDQVPGATPVISSAKVACGTSFGSICFGSFTVAIFQAAQSVARFMKDQAREDGNAVLCVIACVLESLLSCIGEIVEWFCTYAYVQCALRGLSFMDSVRATFALCRISNMQLVCSGMLVDSVVGFLAFICGIIGALSAVGTGSSFALARCFVVGLYAGFCFLLPIRCGAVTLAVCWAEHPEALGRTAPALQEAFCQALGVPVPPVPQVEMQGRELR